MLAEQWPVLAHEYFKTSYLGSCHGEQAVAHCNAQGLRAEVATNQGVLKIHIREDLKLMLQPLRHPSEREDHQSRLGSQLSHSYAGMSCHNFLARPVW